MIILGIDPGNAICGYGVIKKNENGESEIIDYGCVRTESHFEQSERLKKIYSGLTKIIKKYNPHIMAVEDIFFYKNLKTAMRVSQSRGVIMLAAAENKIRVMEYTPLQIKQAMTGYGRAEKNQVQEMIKMVFNLKEIPKPDDAADALAVAVCCAHSIKYHAD